MIKNNQYIVIGSGPSGVSCATALLKKKNIKVLMLDTGYELEKDLELEAKKLYKIDHSKWPKETFNTKPDLYYKGVPLKKLFGSNFTYQISQPYTYKFKKEIGIRPSFAKGGFSNIWGGAIMPSYKNDILDWPISFKKLKPYYKKVVKLFDITGQKDSLSKYFPTFKNKLTKLNLSEQGEAIYKFLNKNEKKLKKKGFFFGRSRLAFNKKKYGGHKDGCIYCGLCLTGCPKNIIYSSVSTLQNLKKNKNFEYLPGITVTSLKENNSKVLINAFENKSKEKISLSGQKVFVGAGVLQTTSIIANTLKLKEHKFEIKDKSLIYLPLLFKKSFSKIYNQETNTLSQIFFEIMDKKITKKFIHGQLYLYNKLYDREINKYLLPLKLLIPKIIEKLVSRLTVLQIYLHSDYSSKLIFHYNSTKPHEIVLEEIRNNKTDDVVKKILQKIKQNRKITGLYPLIFYKKLATAGHSYHSGGTMPMERIKTKEISTDLLGRPNNLKRIHCIDASILPSIPATTITLTIMANAYRIGSES